MVSSATSAGRPGPTNGACLLFNPRWVPAPWAARCTISTVDFSKGVLLGKLVPWMELESVII